ncbi:MAG: hypothetical protein JSV35_00240 [Candidatus Bathyarchaeota archaeon]|nr:MAG: hypothetical protein JSV35_00240 [Candidatus Bathyarchaeota archaeon]
MLVMNIVLKKRVVKALFCTLLGALALGFILNSSYGTLPPSSCHLSPDPPTYIGESQGERFDVEIEISDVENLSKFEFVMKFNSSILHVQNIQRGSLIPADALLEFSVDDQSGSICVNMSLLEVQEPISGDGSLTKLSFEVLGSLASVGSPICFQEILLLDPNGDELDCRHVSAIFFWCSVEPCDLDGDRYEDVYTQKGGEGPGVFGGFFVYGEEVILIAYASYCGWPQENLLVAFQVLDPRNVTQLIFVTETNQTGIASTSFRIPESPDSLGRWIVIASVDIACTIIWDTLIFRVESPVGGRTTYITVDMHQRLAAYILIAGIATGFLRTRKSRFVFKARDRQ